VQDRLARVEGRHAQVEALSEETVTRPAGPGDRSPPSFRLFPRGPSSPRGLKPRPFLFAPDGKLTLVKRRQGPGNYCIASAGPAKDENAEPRTWPGLVGAWWSMRQDGLLYKFKTIKDATKCRPLRSGGARRQARAVVLEGGNGEIAVE